MISRKFVLGISGTLFRLERDVNRLGLYSSGLAALIDTATRRLDMHLVVLGTRKAQGEYEAPTSNPSAATSRYSSGATGFIQNATLFMPHI